MLNTDIKSDEKEVHINIFQHMAGVDTINETRNFSQFLLCQLHYLVSFYLSSLHGHNVYNGNVGLKLFLLVTMDEIDFKEIS